MEIFNTQSREWAVALGQIPGAQPISAYGERTSTGAETNFPIWPDGAFRIPSAAGVQMSIVSTSAQDTNSTGTSAWSVTLHYLDSDLQEQEETVLLNGLTPTLTVATDIRFIQCVHIAKGAGVAAGLISVSNGGVTYSQISAGETRCTSAFRMVPAGYNLFIIGAAASSISGTASTQSKIRLISNYIHGRQSAFFFPIGSACLQDGAVAMQLPPGEGLPPGSIMGAQHTSDKAATVSLTWYGLLLPK